MQAILFAATADAGTSREIYESALGFPCEEDTLFALVFDVSATQLRVRKVETVVNPSYTTLGFAVTDIANTIAEIRTEGVQFEFYELMKQDHSEIRTAPDGTAIARCKDPNGNMISFTQYAAAGDPG
jgi:predicted enzyme related to lactoylglutathione lyase